MPNYKMKTNAGPFQADQVVTDADIKKAGADVKDWTDIGAIEPTNDKRTEGVNPTAIPGNPLSAPKPATNATTTVLPSGAVVGPGGTHPNEANPQPAK